MLNLTLNHKILIVPLLVAMTSCNRPVKDAAEKAVPRTFASPSDAGAALFAAARSGDRTALVEIFGPEGSEVLFTGDPTRDKAGLRDFASAYLRMNRWGKIKAGGQTLYVGPDNYAFPIPLGQNSSGQWYFDTAAGKDEILARRIGRHELAAIEACDSLARAQKLYFSQIHDHARQYARKFVSDPGKQDGLYWPVTAGRLMSPLAELGDFGKVVASTSGDRPPLFNGYYYRILAEPSDLVAGGMMRGFAILAYPAKYRDSGIMTFLMDQRGVVYQKDLGEKTGDVALAMKEFKASDGWSPAVLQTAD